MRRDPVAHLVFGSTYAMPTAAALNETFAIQDHLSFHDSVNDSNHPTGLVELRITTPAAEATIYTQGAHLTRWNPTGEQPALYLSPKSNFTPGKAIRGGVPVLFPWFADGWDHRRQPAHGFARITEWTVQRTHLDPAGDVHVTLSLAPTEAFVAAGYAHFAATIEFRIGSTLAIILNVTNTGAENMVFEEGLHTYFAVGDVHGTATEGLEGTTYIDKRDGNTRKVQRDRLLRYTRDVDQVHVQTADALKIHDAAWKRALLIEKEGSNATVTWNPWSTTIGSLNDMPPDAWEHFVCVETVNVGDDRVTLVPGATHRMATRVSVEPQS